jgi:hypothetical protein
LAVLANRTPTQCSELPEQVNSEKFGQRGCPSLCGSFRGKWSSHGQGAKFEFWAMHDWENFSEPPGHFYSLIVQPLLILLSSLSIDAQKILLQPFPARLNVS